LGRGFLESERPARALWVRIRRGAAKLFGVKHERGMPRPKVEEPSRGYKHASPLTLARFFAGESNGAAFVSTCAVAIAADNEAPEWVELIPAGKFSAVDGRGPFDNQDPDSIVGASIAKMPQVGLVLDYDHSTDLAAPEGRPAPAAGWLKQFKIENGAIFARIEWTADAAEALKEKKYRYVSPVFEHDKDGKVERILRAALTNNPALVNLPAIASAAPSQDLHPSLSRTHPHLASPAKERVRDRQAGEGHPGAKRSETGVASMAKKEKMAGEKSISEIVAGLEELFPEMPAAKILEMAAAALGESDDDNDDDDDDEAAAGNEQNDPYGNETPDQMAARQADEMAKCASDGKKPELAAKHAAEKERFAKRMCVLAASERVGAQAMRTSGEHRKRKEIDAAIDRHPRVVQVMSEINALRLERAKEAATAKVDAAIREGRLIPSHRDWAISYCTTESTGFDKFIGAAPRILRNGPDGTFTARIGEAPQGASRFNKRQVEILANLGLESKEQLEKCAAVQSKWDLKFPRPRLLLDDSNSGNPVDK
jgi:phage I-like protein